MDDERTNGKQDISWIFKITATVIVLALTLRFAGSFSSVISKSSEAVLLNYDFITGYLSADVKTDKNTDGQTSLIKEETETNSLPDSDDEPERSFYETPEDVAEMESAYLEIYADAPVSGQVEEVFFRTSGSTTSAEGIYIKNTTATKNPDFSALLDEGPVITINDKSEPTVLIFHTHTTESYLLSYTGSFYEDFETRSTDNSKNMVRIGEEICRVLEKNDIGYIHDKTIHDESYNGAYSRSRETVEKYLSKYPSIKITLDIHRDAIYYSDTSHCKPTAEIDGKKAAQVMIITGAEEGYISDFPNWENNLKLALSIQKTAEEIYPGLMKPLYFCQRKYNMDLAECSLLLEIGTDANTLDEALYSAYMTGEVLSKILNNTDGE